MHNLKEKNGLDLFKVRPGTRKVRPKEKDASTVRRSFNIHTISIQYACIFRKRGHVTRSPSIYGSSVQPVKSTDGQVGGEEILLSHRNKNSAFPPFAKGDVLCFFACPSISQ